MIENAPAFRPSVGFLAATAFVAFGFSVAEATPGPCLSEKAPFLGALAGHLSRFQTELKRASNTSRVALHAEVDALRRIRGETSRLLPPPCAARLSRHVLDAMDIEVRTLRRFLKMSDAELSLWERAPEAEKRRILRRSESEQAWRLVAFELRILRSQATLLPADAN